MRRFVCTHDIKGPRRRKRGFLYLVTEYPEAERRNMQTTPDQFVQSCIGTKNAAHLILLYVRQEKQTIFGCIGTIVDATSDFLSLRSYGREELIKIDLRCLHFDTDDLWWVGHSKWGLYDHHGDGWDLIDCESALNSTTS
jgi:RNase P/RNase MRP subunit p29